MDKTLEERAWERVRDRYLMTAAFRAAGERLYLEYGVPAVEAAGLAREELERFKKEAADGPNP